MRLTKDELIRFAKIVRKAHRLYRTFTNPDMQLLLAMLKQLEAEHEGPHPSP